MKSAVITAFNSDPYIAALFKKSIDLWIDEVDEIHICIHGENEKMNSVIKNIFDNNSKIFIYLPDEKFTELGQAFDYMYSCIKSDLLITIDSDTFIFKSGIIKRHIDKMDRYDVIGTKGQSCKPIKDAWKILQKNYGMVRINSMFSIWDKKKIDSLDHPSFKRKIYREGDYIKEIDLKIDNKLMIDTMGELTIKYLNKYNRIYFSDAKDSEMHHVGGMSSMSKRFLGNNGISVYGLESDKLENIFEADRLAWHLYSYFIGKQYCDKEFNNLFINSLKDKIIQSEFNFDDIVNIANNIDKLWD